MALLPRDGSWSRAVSQSHITLEQASILLRSVFVSSPPLKNSSSWTNGALPFVMRISYVHYQTSNKSQSYMTISDMLGMLNSFLFASETMGPQKAQRFDESPRAGSDSLKECWVKSWRWRRDCTGDPRMLEKSALQDIWQGELSTHMVLTQQEGYTGYSS